MKKKSPNVTLLVCICVSALIAGCTARRRPPIARVQRLKRPNQMNTELATRRDEFAPLSSRLSADKLAAFSSNTTAPDRALRLESALALALLNNPTLKIHDLSVRVAEAELLQKRVRANPELGIQMGEYDRRDDGLDSAEFSFTLAQLLETGGKRRWRMRVANITGQLASWEFEQARLEVLTETAKRFMLVVAARKHLELVRDAVELARTTRLIVDERVKVGKASPPQLLKADGELALARLNIKQAESRLTLAKNHLAEMWGRERANFTQVEGVFDEVSEAIPSLDDLRAQLEANPALARCRAEVALGKAMVSATRASRVPNIEATVGVQSFREDEATGYIFGVGLPLPIFDRKVGELDAARARHQQAAAKHSATAAALSSKLRRLHAELTTEHERLRGLRTEVLPVMQQAYDAANEGYREGKFRLLDLLDSQRRLFDTRSMILTSLSRYHSLVSDIQQITGGAPRRPALDGQE